MSDSHRPTDTNYINLIKFKCLYLRALTKMYYSSTVNSTLLISNNKL